MRSFAPALAILSLPLFAVAASHGRHLRGHGGLAARARGDVLDRRDFSGRLTYYDITVGLTACGGSFSASDYVVALNGDQFGNIPGSSQYCGASITITFNGKSVTATVQDKCPGCPYGGLDLTEGVFKALTGGSLTAGVLQGTWSFGSGSGSAPKEEPTTTTPAYTPPQTSSTPEYAYNPPTTTTHHNAPSSTPHYNPPSSSQHSNSPSPTPQTSSSTPSPPPSSSSKPSSSSSSSTTSSTSAAYTSHSHSPSSPATTPSSSALPTASSVGDPAGTIDDNGDPEAIEGLYGAIVGLGDVIESCQN